jgi:uncharacterized protein YegL
MKTEVIIVLDRSGSMATIAKDMRGGFDTFIAEQKALPGECAVTLVQFNQLYETVYEAKPIAEVPPLDLFPGGFTALLDAVGHTIDRVGVRLAGTPEGDRPDKVVFVIITDGHENSSHEYSRDAIFDRITHQRAKYSWEFLFLGAGENALTQALDLGISMHDTAAYKAQPGDSVSSVLRSVSHSVTSARAGATMGVLQATYNSLVDKT